MKSKDVKIEYKYREFYEFFRRETSRAKTGVSGKESHRDGDFYEKVLDATLVDEIYSRFIREKIVKKAEENQKEKCKRENAAEKRNISALKSDRQKPSAKTEGKRPARRTERGAWADWIDKNEKNSDALLLKLSEEKTADFANYIQAAFSAAKKRRARR